jgi:hypothetical protein
MHLRLLVLDHRLSFIVRLIIYLLKNKFIAFYCTACDSSEDVSEIFTLTWILRSNVGLTLPSIFTSQLP